MNIEDTTKTASLGNPQDNIPRTKQQRELLLDTIRQYVEEEKPVTPLSFNELGVHSDKVLDIAGMDKKYADFAAVLINNEAWRKTVASIPYERRLLLLPNCLRDHEKCQGQFDDVGLICEHCGNCIIDEFKSRAEELGYAVLVAEGSPIVMSLIETGKIEAVIGVSCLSVLERTFPYMEAAAIAGIAIPLLCEGCKNTMADADWVWQAIYESSEERSTQLNLESIRKEVSAWFECDSLRLLACKGKSDTEKIALDWLGGEGKRWRPFLATCVCKALNAGDGSDLPDGIREVAVAVECFHKASLIHDDIEDGDLTRYGKSTLHVKAGIPVALNTGDLLLGEGYRLLSEVGVSDSKRVRMLAVAARGHNDLCVGQGKELTWMSDPKPLLESEVIDIFKKKTSPAFAVALKVGAIFAGTDDATLAALDSYSVSLGIAYQIRDDLQDFSFGEDSGDLDAMRPSLLLAMTYQQATGDDKKLIESVWNRSTQFKDAKSRIQDAIARLSIRQKAFATMESYKGRAIESIASLKSAPLKGLLRRVIYKIFNDVNVMDCCNDYTAGTGRGGEQSDETAG
ncbi:MAG: DUF116 domain-containing protein [Planctomycetes bacterium]|nr:DUF116 domain-containing protein [Planctomycetota bacterium]